MDVLGKDSGACVQSVIPGGAAYQCGAIKPGMIITAVNGEISLIHTLSFYIILALLYSPLLCKYIANCGCGY